jgi:sirohydrochlorin cobaltochelatase
MHFQPDALLLIGHGSPDAASNAEFYRFAEDLGQHLGVAIQPCFLELAEPSIGEGFARCVAAGARRVAALPLFLGAGRHQKRDVPDLLAEAQAAHPGVMLRYGAPLGSQLHLIDTLAARAAAALAQSNRSVPPDVTALLVVGRGSKDPQSNAELPRLARLLAELYGHPLVEYAYQAVVGPDVGQAVTRCARLGAQRVVVLPYLLFTGFVRDDIARQARLAQEQHPELEILIGEHLFPHPGLLTAAAARYREIVEGTATMTCDLCVYRRRAIDAEAHAHHHGAHHHSDEEVHP